MEPALTGRNWLCFVSRPKRVSRRALRHHGSIVSSHGKQGQALDARLPFPRLSLLPLPDGVALAICNTMVKHQHRQGRIQPAPSRMRSGCARALEMSAPRACLADVTAEDLDTFGHNLPDVVRRRCHHVISDNARVRQAATALESEDLPAFGKR